MSDSAITGVAGALTQIGRDSAVLPLRGGEIVVKSLEFGDARLPDRFWGKVQVAESGCWMWRGADHPDGYSRYWHGGRVVYGHRLTVEVSRGHVDAAMEIDHLCRTPACVNPAHLEAVTGPENRRRTRAETCSAGHSMADAYRSGDKRRCRHCNRAWARRRRAA